MDDAAGLLNESLQILLDIDFNGAGPGSIHLVDAHDLVAAVHKTVGLIHQVVFTIFVDTLDQDGLALQDTRNLVLAGGLGGLTIDAHRNGIREERPRIGLVVPHQSNDYIIAVIHVVRTRGVTALIVKIISIDANLQRQVDVPLIANLLHAAQHIAVRQQAADHILVLNREVDAINGYLTIEQIRQFFCSWSLGIFTNDMHIDTGRYIPLDAVPSQLDQHVIHSGMGTGFKAVVLVVLAGVSAASQH